MTYIDILLLTLAILFGLLCGWIGWHMAYAHIRSTLMGEEAVRRGWPSDGSGE